MPRKLPTTGEKQLEAKLEQLYISGINLGEIPDDKTMDQLDYAKALITEKGQLLAEILKMYRTR